MNGSGSGWRLGRWLVAAACAGCFSIGAFRPAPADDGWVGVNSGLVSLLDGEEEHIAMRSARVKVDMTPETAWVECDFVFENTGPAKAVLMGFPETEAVALEGEGGRLRDFRSWVDGQRVETAWRPGTSRDGEGIGWHTKEVHFAAGQTRLVRDTYQAKYGGSVVGDTFFYYPMHTGASWQGPIGLMEVTVRLRDFEGKTISDIRPEPYERTGDSIRWTFRDIEPGQDDAPWSVGVTFFGFYTGLRWNGAVPCGVPHSYAEIKAGRVFIPARWDWPVSDWVEYDARTGAATITKGLHTFRVTVGSTRALADGEPWQLPAPPYVHEQRLMIPLRPFVEALGGSVHRDPQTDETRVHCPDYQRCTGLRWNGKVADDLDKAEPWMRIEHGQLLVDARELGSLLDADYSHDEAAGTVTMAHNGHTATLTLDSTDAIADGEPFALAVPPYLLLTHEDGCRWSEWIGIERVLVPLRPVIEKLGGTVSYSSPERTEITLG